MTSASASRPPDSSHVAETVRSKLPFSARLSKIIPLPGDASNRRYFRLELQGQRDSVILMQLASPEAFKQSEEAVTGTTTITELPFINILDHLAKADIPVPALYHYDADAGLLYLEDFGDVTLVQAYQHGTGQTRQSLYREAIEILAQMQLRASTHHPRCLAFQRAFDVPLLMWELDHFVEYGIEARRGPLSTADRVTIRKEFQNISELLASQPKVFAHRDYHSRNLMVRSCESRSRLGVIDFQDALLGPSTYDLASLLRDAYVALEEAFIEDLLAYYRELMLKQGCPTPERHELRKLFDLTSIQRNLKAAGRFVYIDRVKHNSSFLTDIPRTLGYVRRNLVKYPELAVLRRHLAPYVPELQ
jgi:aminoglycoside/choline kinase family phosphotransferase